MQGSDLMQMTDKGAPRVTIVHHPDVRRALLTQKAYAEGLRALYLYTAAHQDVTVADSVSGVDAEMADRVNDLLVPIVKGVGSERAYPCLTESLQTLGASCKTTRPSSTSATAKNVFSPSCHQQSVVSYLIDVKSPFSWRIGRILPPCVATG